MALELTFPGGTVADRNTSWKRRATADIQVNSMNSPGQHVRHHTRWMPRLIGMLSAIAFATCLAIPAVAQDMENGHQIAKRWCSGCHEIAYTPVQNDVSPPFITVARMPTTTRISLQAFLSTPHQRMPDYSLSRQEISDVSAYILSLK